MTMPSSAPLRAAIAALLIAFATITVLRLVGGPDPLGEAYSGIWAALMLAWILPNLRGEPPGWPRTCMWIGVVAFTGLIVLTIGELLL